MKKHNLSLLGFERRYPHLEGEKITAGRLQHLGIRFQPDGDFCFYRPFSLQAEIECPDNLVFAPAVTAAALICRRARFQELNGFSEQYDYGYKDVDLALRNIFIFGDKPAVLRQKFLIHDESPTQQTDHKADINKRRMNNIRVLQERFGALVRQGILSDLIAGCRFWTARRLTIGFAVTEANEQTRAGDYFSAMELGEAIKNELGWEVRYLPKFGATSSWYDLKGIDVLISMLDEYNLNATTSCQPGLITVAWMRNWLNLWTTRPWFEAYDIYLCSSNKAADYIRERKHKKAHILRLATNPKRFSERPAGKPYEYDYCLVGGYFGANREVETALIPHTCDARFALFGEGWGENPDFEAYYRGFLPYARVPEIYQAAKIVLDDADHATKSWGSLNSRVYDALATGALVISNNSIGADEVFSGELPIYESGPQLQELLKRYLSDETARRTVIKKCRQVFLSEHTY